MTPPQCGRIFGGFDMASMMCRLTFKELIELLKDKPDDEFVGYLFSAAESVNAPEHQVLVFYEPIKPM